MTPAQRIRRSASPVAASLMVLLGGATAAATPPPAPDVAAQARGCAPFADFEPASFPREPVVDNPWLPLVPGRQLVLTGQRSHGGGLAPHTVVFTVLDLTKVIDGVRTVVVYDVDTDQGQVTEAELAFFAQDRAGTVWNLGEYPEVYQNGVFAGAPDTWMSGVAGAEAGVHMPADPQVGQAYRQGLAPQIGFLDCARVVDLHASTCVPIGCFTPTLMTHETSPLDPAGGVQTKEHARGIGIVRVGALNDPEAETLVATSVTQLGPQQLATARAAARMLESRAYRVSGVYRHTPPMRRADST